MAYTISVTPGSNGTTIPDTASASVPTGAGYLIKFTPFEGYRVADVLIDGVSIGAVDQYMFTNVQANHTVAVSYAMSHYHAVSRYTLSNLASTVDPALTPQYDGLRLKAQVSSPTVQSNATLTLGNATNSVSFNWVPGKASLSFRTFDDTYGEWGGRTVSAPSGLGPYWVEMTVKGKFVEASLKGPDGMRLFLDGILTPSVGNNVATGWVVSVDSASSGPGVNETLFEGYKVVADDKQSTIIVGSAYSETSGKLLTVLAG